MKDYDFREIEQKWQRYWAENQTFRTDESSGRKPYYVLDMFPYPSGAGLHVGHPLGYIATDILARYKRHRGHEVLHPMGFDAFGLPAEQYAIETGQHPATITERNINRYRQQLSAIGLGYDWSREVQTCDPQYYKWTQWIFLQLYKSWYNEKAGKAESIDTLKKHLEQHGTEGLQAAAGEKLSFSPEEWKAKDWREQERLLQNFRLAYLAYAEVNWCPALGTVLANEEVKEGRSERGGYPVVKKKMRQWFLRITAYADRLLDDLDTIEWSEALKEMQRNWIGRSTGAEVHFLVDQDQVHEPLSTPPEENAAEIANTAAEDMEPLSLKVFTTRPDTIFGSTFMVIAPEHPLVKRLTVAGQKEAVEKYVEQAKQKSERERMTNVKEVTGIFTGSNCLHPFTSREVPIWISDYVLAEYGTGAVMAVPAHDSRDFAFAKHFDLPIRQVIRDKADPEQVANPLEESHDAKDGVMINSEFLNGLDPLKAIDVVIDHIEQEGLGKRQINYRLRDANFSRQRYWGEPFPIVYDGETPLPIDESELPLELPPVQSYKPSGTGESPLAAVEDWVNLPDGKKRETNTMPGWAGSSWYFLRYMDPKNTQQLVSPEREKYWQNVDFYVGGTEHATSHLLYSRFWHKFLYDIGVVTTQEPFKKLVNQGMIQGVSLFMTQLEAENGQGETRHFIGQQQLKKQGEIQVNGTTWRITGSRSWRIPVEYADEKGRLHRQRFAEVQELPMLQQNLADVNPAEDVVWEQEEGQEFITLRPEVEKMSKSKYNVVNPDDIIGKYGADTLRMYEMFLGPIEQSKPWNTEGIDGVHRFLRKFWRLFHNDQGIHLTQEEPTEEEMKSLHQCLKKVNEDVERLSFNTCISAFMICTNELSSLGCTKQQVLEPLIIAISPFAPHLAEELWQQLHESTGREYSGSITTQPYPQHEEKWLQEDTVEYPVSVNGKVRAKLQVPANATKDQVEEAALGMEAVQKWIDSKPIRKFIFVPGRIVNIVV